MKRRFMAILLLAVIIFGTFTAFTTPSYAADKSTGLYKIDGQWQYYENGSFKAATGLVQRPDNKTWHYVEDGIYKKSTGLVKCVQPGTSKGNWYYVERGDLNKEVTGLVKCVQPGTSNGKWYYVSNGKLNNNATGLVQCVHPGKSQGKWYYVEAGKLKSNATGLVKCIQPDSESKGKWYHVENGKRSNETGLVECIQPGTYEGNWYYVKSGKKKDVTIIYEDEVEDESGLWYVENGKVKFVTGWREVDGSEYYIDGGVALSNGWHTVKGKRYCFDDTGKLNPTWELEKLKSAVTQATDGAGWSPTVIGGTVSHETLMAIKEDMQTIYKSGVDLGFVLVDINTGAVIMGNPNKVFYAASTIKGPYVWAVAEKRSSEAPNYKSYIKPTIEVSRNDTYEYLRKVFGSDIMKEFMNEAGVTTVPAYANWVDMRPCDLAKLWIRSYEYITSEGPNVDWVKPYFEVAYPSFILAALKDKYTVCSKPGWLYSGGKYTVYNDGGVVEKSGSPYILAVMSNCTEGTYNARLQILVRDLDKAHSEMISGE